MPALQSPFGAIKLTELGTKEASSAAQSLKGRERQFLLLLQRNDNISRQVCAAMLPKVELQILLSHRLIWVEDEAKFQAQWQNADVVDQAKVPSPLSANEEDGDLDPMLQLAAGMV